MNHKTYILVHNLLAALDAEREFNGHTDSRQVIVWSKDGQELARSEDGELTYTPKFKEMTMQMVNEML